MKSFANKRSHTVFTAFTRRLLRIFLCATVGLSAAPAFAQTKDLQIHVVEKGQAADLYFEINLKGTVYVHVAAREGESNCADFWWIKWPFGSVQSLGRHCGSASFKIPGVFDLAFSSKLRVGGTDNKVKIALSANEALANSATFDF